MLNPRLIVITDSATLPSRDLLLRRATAVVSAAKPGSVALLLRDHDATATERLALGQELRRLTSSFGQQLWVADRLDLAVLLGADAAHLGEASVPATTARRLVGRGMALSRAWHCLELEPSNELADVDAIVLSPILAERKGRPALGVPALAELRAALQLAKRQLAIYALGGIDAQSAASCIAAGASGVATISAGLIGDYEALLAALGIVR